MTTQQNTTNLSLPQSSVNQIDGLLEEDIMAVHDFLAGASHLLNKGHIDGEDAGVVIRASSSALLELAVDL